MSYRVENEHAPAPEPESGDHLFFYVPQGSEEAFRLVPLYTTESVDAYGRPVVMTAFGLAEAG